MLKDALLDHEVVQSVYIRLDALKKSIFALVNGISNWLVLRLACTQGRESIKRNGLRMEDGGMDKTGEACIGEANS
ncbi:hypothetical protein YC2023_041531 [Brassica napus]